MADQADFIAQGISDADLNVFFDVLNTVRENCRKDRGRQLVSVPPIFRGCGTTSFRK